MSSREVTLDGGSPWGFRMHGGADAQLPLRIARVNPGSKAALRGIREGDLISSINGRATSGLSNAEAHALLRSAHDTLTLGLNQGATGSPKRRSQKLAQDKEENSKRTTVTSSSSSTSTFNVSTTSYSLSNSKYSNESTHTNGVCDTPLTQNKTKNSQCETQSSFSSIRNGSPFTTPQGATTNDSERSRGERDDILEQNATSVEAHSNDSSSAVDDSVISGTRDNDVIMADNAGSSRSRRQRRARANRKKAKKTNSNTADTTTVTEKESKTSEEIDSSYKVEFPATNKMTEKKSSNIVKSRSLDDDDQVKITEVTEEEKTVCLTESTAVVSETESDVEWETVSNLSTENKPSEQQFGNLSVITLPLEDHVTYDPSHISPEDERSLRDFLEGLNLVNSPEESAKRIESTADSPKAKKIKKRTALAQHFLPFYQNPRYLDVISEEGSDLSDRDNKQNTVFRTRLFECDDEDEDDVFEEPKVTEKKLQNKYQTRFAGTSEEPILVGTKLIDNHNKDLVVIKEASWSTSMAETQSGAELVYLEDSSNSMTPSDLLDLEDTAGDVDADDEDDISVDLDKTYSDLNTSEIKEISITSSETTSRASLPTDSEQMKSEITDTLPNDNKAIPMPPSSGNTIDFLQKLLLTLNNDSKDILVTLSEDKAQNLPKHLKDKLMSFTKSKGDNGKNELLDEINNFKQIISRGNSEEKDQKREPSIEKCSDNEELKKELKTICDNFQTEIKQSDSARTSESRSNSANSAHSSQCTAVYNPLHSSLSNIAALLREGSFEERSEPFSLREICIRALLDMPFGRDVIEELANVSKSIEEITCRTPSCALTSRPLTSHPLTSRSVTSTHNPSLNSPTNKSTNIDVSSVSPVVSPVAQSMDTNFERWIGMPSEDNPNVLVCLSPSQKEFIDKTKAVPNEADSLLDLHRKFFERRTYQDSIFTPKPTIDVPAFKIQVNANTNNLLKIMQDSSDCENFEQKDLRVNSGNISYDKYIKQLVREVPIEVEKHMNKPVNNKIYRDAPPQETRIHGDRLKARHLGEWLNLARNENNNYLRENKLITQRSCEERFSNILNDTSQRRYSLPFNLYEEQMQYILEKEREVQQEIERLNEEKCKLESDSAPDSPSKTFDAAKYQISRKGDIAILSESDKFFNKSFPNSEKFREEMYNEYMCKVAERQERKQNKVIKLKISEENHELNSQYDVKHVCGIEDEFMSKVREKKEKLGLLEQDNEEMDEPLPSPVRVLDGDSLTDVTKLPKHLQEFIDITTTNPDSAAGVWSPGKSIDSEPLPVLSEPKSAAGAEPAAEKKEGDEPGPVVWTPRSAGSSPTAERKEFRPVNFESPVLKRKNPKQETSSTPESVPSIPPPWQNKEVVSSVTTVTEERRLTSSQSAPAAGLTSLGKLPRAQNPTITLLQKAREGQLPRGASYIEDNRPPSPKPRSKDHRPPLIGPHEILYTVKNEYLSESENEKPKKMADLGSRKFEGIGPTTKDGMPIVLRSEVKDSNQAKWYKRMYDTLHRARNDDECVTVRYKTRRGRYPYTSAGGYLSEPEPNAYDSDAGISASKYATLDRRRYQNGKDKENEYITYTVPRNKYMSASVRHSTDIYKNQPGRIEDYIPGHSSISEKEAKEHLEQQKHVPPTKSFMSHALKESGYESDSTLVFRRREDAALQLSPHEQKEVYKSIQKGGEVPLHGLRKLAPERPKESPRKYVEDEVTIHYRSPVRHEVKEILSEEELARRQAEAMRRIYQEERRRKYLQELQDMNSRRHTDNFTPSQKSPISLNRYDDFGDDLSVKLRGRSRSPEPRLVARALYNFVGQSARELTFRKGDIIFIRRQVDKNWFEGEHNAMLGLFPSNYVEIVPYDGVKSTPRKAHEGQARAKFNFIAQTHLELSLAKGELVVLTRRIDDNWFEGRIGSRKGIFPVSYVEILIDPGEKSDVTLSSSKPVASPAAHSLLLNGSAGGKESMGSHHYQPSYSSPPTTTSYHAKPVNVIGSSSSYSSLTRTQKKSAPAVNEALHIDTQSEPVPYRALYKYRPQNDDELELQEGDTVFVLEKCDDGWYVGSSQRTGSFGTFPGNYVERI